MTIDAAKAIKLYGVGVKCATITPDEARVKEFHLKEMWKSPTAPSATSWAASSSASRSSEERAPPGPQLDRADHHRPPRLWRPVSCHRFQGAGQGRLTIRFEREDGALIEREVFKFPGGGVAMPMYNLDDSIRDFAHASLNLASAQKSPLSVDQEHDPESYDGRFKDIFEEVYDAEFKSRSRSRYHLRTSPDRRMVAAALKWSGGYVWACKNYDGDVQSDTVAQGFGSLGLMTCVLITPDGKTMEAEAAHGTVTRHYREHQRPNHLYQSDRHHLCLDPRSGLPR